MPKAKLMIVEDEWVIADDLRVCLEGMEYEVSSVVTRGEEALKKAEEDRPDLIIMDIMLRGDMNGIEAAEQIRKRFHIPQIYITAYADDHMLEKAKITEPLGYLIKPFDDKELHAVIEMALYKSKMEKQLRESEEKFRSLFNQATDSIFLMSPTDDGLIIEDANDASLNMHGYRRDEMIGMSVADLDDPETAKLLPERKKLLAAGKALNFEGQHRRKDGSIFPIDVSARLVHIGGTPYVLAIDRDISARKLAEKALLESEKKYRLLFTTVPTGWAYHKIIVNEENKPVDYVFLEVNDAFEKLTGLKKEYIIGKRVTEVLPGIENDPVDLIGRYGEVALTGKETKFESFSEALDKWYSVSASSPEKEYFIVIFDDITKKKRAEEEREKSRSLLTTVLDGLEAVVYVADMNTYEVLYVNKYMRNIFGDLTGKICWQSIQTGQTGPCGFCTNKYLLDESGRPGGVHHWEFQNTVNGHWYDIRDRAIEWIDGRIARIEIAYDITERKQSEEALREGEERFQGAFDSAAIGISLVTPEGRWLKVNEVLCDIVGYSEEELLALSFQDITYPEDIDADLAYVRQMLAGNIRHFHMEKRYIHKDGHLVWILLSVSLVRDKEGNPLYFVSQIQDITGRKSAETELAQRSELAELGADIGIALTKGKILRDTLQQCCNEFVHHLDVAFARIWTLNEGDNMLELQASAGMYAHIDGAHSRIPVGEYKIGLIAKNRQPHLSNNILEDPHISDREWAKCEGMKSFAGHPLMIKDRIVGVMGMFSRNHLEPITLKALSSVADELAIGIERLRSEEELKRVNAELENKSWEMEQLVHVTSHDLRTPLAIVQGYSKELEITISEILSEVGGEGISSDIKKRLDPHFNDIRDTNKYIQSNVRKMDSLLHGLLKLSRSGNVELAIEPLDMNELLSDVHISLALKVREAGARVEISDLPSCLGDRDQINQVFSNLLGNALKYLDPDRPGVITISGYRDEREAFYCVEDNGIGIASDDKDRIFNIFYQSNAQAQGEGLGLTIVRKIVERHGGRVWVESGPGKGSRFCVALPGEKAGQAGKARSAGKELGSKE